MTRRVHVPTDESHRQVQTMAGYGIPQEDICIVLDVTGKTLRKYYKEQLKNGKIQASAAVIGALYKNAISGNVSAQIYWTKAQCGWSERQQEVEDLKAKLLALEERLERLGAA